MIRKTALALLLATTGLSAQAALSAGDIAFTSFNADEDGLSFVTFTEIAANTTIYFTDNEYVSSAFNTGESFSKWISGTSNIAAGTVVRLNNIDSATLLGASVGTFSRVAVSGSTNYGISTSAETVYAYLGSSAIAPSTFLSAITNAATFNTTDGSLVGTGLTEGVNAIRLTTLATSATPDYAEYNGARTGEVSFAAYKSKVADIANWTVDTTNGTYTSTVPNITAFAIAAVPEPSNYAMLLAGLGVMGFIARRRSTF